jgi:hypothetical protein
MAHWRAAVKLMQFMRLIYERRGSLQLDAVTDHPKLELIEARLPSSLEFAHPLPVLYQIGNVDHQSHKIVAVNDSPVSPMPLNLLSLVTGRPKMIDDFKYSFGEPFLWN